MIHKGHSRVRQCRSSSISRQSLLQTPVVLVGGLTGFALFDSRVTNTDERDMVRNISNNLDLKICHCGLRYLKCC